MSQVDKQALRSVAENATPGEWCIDECHGVIADAGLNANYYIALCSGPDHRANARYIAAANPATMLALLDENEALVRANSAQDDHINQQQDRIDQLEKGTHEAAKQISSWRRIAKQNMEELVNLKELLPEIECDICGFKSTDPDGAHHCCEDNSND
ncbi:ead/Ea22-like family protein [Edwardsiella tarda]|uniref:ead/Ea22-like family protein n=1 Tax=Edwardsiella tarda TaxID=636 RepID=UPI003F6565C1